MIFRLATAHDIPQIASLERARDVRDLVGHWPEDKHRRMLEDPDAAYWVYEDPNGQVLGFAILEGLQSEHRSILLRRIVVGVTDKGLGRIFLSFLLDKVFESYNAHRLWLDVFETNTRARRVYRALGFREDGALREAHLRDGVFHSLVLMSLLEDEYRHALP
jgi:RimJ/RimL family protein N-acetyltransferase